MYNYLELREELVSRGVAFRTRSEIETLVALYENHGTSFINRLRGMFAFLIYDNKTGVLMAGRDPFGIKPLYYRETADGHVFASEMKAFLFDSGYDGFKVDPTLLQHYLTFQYVTEPDTITGDIRILPKGSYMLCDGEHTETECYYRPVFAPAKGSYAEKKLRLREAVERSVESHMLSDVPLGSFLSSGVDSAVITAVASKLSPGIKAFTVGFDVPGYSELEDAAAISAHLDIDHIKLQCTLKDFTDSYEKVIYHLDSPVGDPSVVADLSHFAGGGAPRQGHPLRRGKRSSCSAATGSTPPRRPATGWDVCRALSRRRWPPSRACCRRRSRAAASCCAG